MTEQQMQTHEFHIYWTVRDFEELVITYPEKVKEFINPKILEEIQTWK